MKNFLKSTRNQSLLGGAIVILLCAAVGYAVTLPNTFTPNTPAKADEVNANFTALTDAITVLEERVDTLEAQKPIPSKNGKVGYATVLIDTTVLNSFNSSGGAVTAVHNGTGQFTVTFAGLGDSVNTDYHVQVTGSPVLTPAAFCMAAVPGGASANIEVLVDCFDSAGNLVDSPFYILVLW